MVTSPPSALFYETLARCTRCSALRVLLASIGTMKTNIKHTKEAIALAPADTGKKSAALGKLIGRNQAATLSEAAQGCYGYASILATVIYANGDGLKKRHWTNKEAVLACMLQADITLPDTMAEWEKLPKAQLKNSANQAIKSHKCINRGSGLRLVRAAKGQSRAIVGYFANPEGDNAPCALRLPVGVTVELIGKPKPKPTRKPTA